MNLPIYTASPVGIAGTNLLNTYNRVGLTIQSTLFQAIQAGSGNDEYTPQEFWAEQGTNGVGVLQVFDTLRTVLKDIYPELMDQSIVDAGDNLVTHPDGTVTVKA